MRLGVAHLLAAMLLVNGSCGRLSGAEKKALAAVVHGLDLTASAPLEQRHTLVAELTYEAFGPKCLGTYAGAGDDDKGMALLDCGLACSTDLAGRLRGLPQHEWGPLIAEACGPRQYGLAPDQAALISPAWYVVRRLGREIAPLYARADDATRRALDQVMARAPVPLVPPAAVSGLYQLPATADRKALPVPVVARTNVVVAGDGRLLASATPVAVLTGRGAEAGGTFPGTAVLIEDLAGRLHELRPAWVPRETPPPAPSDTLGAGCVVGVVEREPRFVGDSGLDNPGQGDGRSLSLVLADARVPAARVVRVLERAGGGYLGVAGPSQTAFALPIVFRARPGEACSAKGADANVPLVIGLADAGLTVVAAERLWKKPRQQDGKLDFKAIRESIRGAREVLASSPASTVVFVDGAVLNTELVSLLVELAGLEAASEVRLVIGPRPAMTADAVAARDQAIREATNGHLGEIRTCYERLRTDSVHCGGVTVRITIDASGAATGARSDWCREEQIDACILGVMRKIPFPKAASGQFYEVDIPVESPLP